MEELAGLSVIEQLGAIEVLRDAVKGLVPILPSESDEEEDEDEE